MNNAEQNEAVGIRDNVRLDTTPLGISANSGMRVRNRPLEEIEQDLQMTYHALLLACRGLNAEQQTTVAKARLIALRAALQAACMVATEDLNEDWTKLRARLLGAARYHYNRDGVKAAPRWTTKARKAQ